MNLARPSIVIRKKDRRLDLYDGDRLVKTYTAVLGSDPTGDKSVEGDGRTPEGEFYVFTKNAQSKFQLSLGLSYPNCPAAERGLIQGLISAAEHDEIVAAINERRMPLQKTALGGEIYIHGGGCDSDWTEGCVALADHEMTELFESIPVGTPVRILP